MKCHSPILAAVAVLLAGCRDASGPSLRDGLTENAEQVDLQFIKSGSAIGVLGLFFPDMGKDTGFEASGPASILEQFKKICSR